MLVGVEFPGSGGNSMSSLTAFPPTTVSVCRFLVFFLHSSVFGCGAGVTNGPSGRAVLSGEEMEMKCAHRYGIYQRMYYTYRKTIRSLVRPHVRLHGVGEVPHKGNCLRFRNVFVMFSRASLLRRRANIRRSDGHTARRLCARLISLRRIQIWSNFVCGCECVLWGL